MKSDANFSSYTEIHRKYTEFCENFLLNSWKNCYSTLGKIVTQLWEKLLLNSGKNSYSTLGKIPLATS